MTCNGYFWTERQRRDCKGAMEDSLLKVLNHTLLTWVTISYPTVALFWDHWATHFVWVSDVCAISQ